MKVHQVPNDKKHELNNKDGDEPSKTKLHANNTTAEKSLILRTHLESEETRKASENKLSMIFFAISLLFLVCHSPRFILGFYKVISRRDWVACQNAGYVGHPIWALILSWASHILLALNSSLNSAIYCVFSSKYREQARKAFALLLK